MLANKKRVFSMVLVVIMVFTILTGCTPAPAQPATTPEPAATPEPVAAPEPVAVEAKAETVNPTVEGLKGMVAAAHPLASLAGTEMLLRGGNAVDAAVAVSFALNVVEPQANCIGGGGFMVYYDAKTQKVTALDYREIAPKAATDGMYELDDNGKVKDDKAGTGHLASGVPGLTAGLMYALENLGTMDRKVVMEPAIRFAEEGFPVSRFTAGAIADNLPRLERYEASKKIYLKDGLPYQEGEIIYQKDLGSTLKKIAEKGADGFYKGSVAKAIADEMKKNGGIITTEDLAYYPTVRPRVLEPMEGTYRGYRIISMPPPSSGGTHLIQMLNMLENFDMKKLGHNTPESIHVMSEVMKRAFADRAAFMGDPDFLDIPLKGLTSKEYAKELADQIKLDQITNAPPAGAPSKHQAANFDLINALAMGAVNDQPNAWNTTHFSVIDPEGNMVAATQTIQRFFGSAVVIPGTGIKMNNEMSDFVPSPGKSNSIAPGKTMISSMSPTLVATPDGKPFLAIGSPGATRIFPRVMQVIMNILDYEMDLQEAIEAPVVWSNSDKIDVEGRIDPEVIKKLEEMGHTINVRAEWDAYYGAVQAVQIDHESGKLRGGADPRRDGRVIGF